MTRAVIVGTGESLRGVALSFPDHVTVIAVNGAIDLVSRCDAWFTLDPSPANEQIMERPRGGVAYFAAVPDSYPQRLAHVNYLRRVEGSGHGRYRTKAGLSPDDGAIHTGNSAWGALQLAVHMGMTHIALLGIDGRGGYVNGGQPRELSMMPELFASAVTELRERGIVVMNGSPESTVTCFPRTTPEKAKAWLCEPTS